MVIGIFRLYYSFLEEEFCKKKKKSIFLNDKAIILLFFVYSIIIIYDLKVLNYKVNLIGSCPSNLLNQMLTI